MTVTTDPRPAPAVAPGTTETPTTPESRAAAPTLAACFLGMFVVTLDAVVVNVALPSIRADLAASMTGLQWVVDAYTLAVAALLLAAGAMADRIGAKRAFAVGMAAFVAASAACAVAPALAGLIAARVVQGSAAALLMPTSMSLIGQVYTDPVRKARAVGLWALGGAVASSAGPVVGGALSTIDWRLIFWINVPVGAVALLLLRRTPTSPRIQHPFDPVGLVLAVLTMGSVTYAAIAVGEHGPTSPIVLGGLLVCVVAGFVFLAYERRARHPMLPLDLFRSRTVSSVTVVGFAFMACYYGTPFVMSLDLQQQRGLSSLATGVVFLPMMLVGLMLTPLSARLVERFGRRLVMIAGLTCMSAGVVGLAAAPTDAALWGIALLMMLVGLGGPTVMPPATAALLTAVAPERGGTASGVLNTGRQVGGALAVAVFGTLLAHDFHSGLQASMAISAALLALTGVVVARYLPNRHGEQR